MNRTRLKICFWDIWMVIALVVLATTIMPPLSAQIPALPGTPAAETAEGASEGEAAPAVDPVEVQLQELESSIAETERFIAENQVLEEAGTEAIPALPLEVVQTRTAAYRKLLLAYQRHRNALRDIIDLQERNATFDAERESALIITEEPPYTMAFLDKLLDEVTVRQMDLDAEVLSLRAVRELVTMEYADIAAAKTELNRTSELLRSASSEDRDRLLYEAETAKVLVTANEAEHKAAAEELKRAEKNNELINKRLQLAQARVERAREQTLFRQDELNTILERQQEAIKELDAEGKKTRDAIEKQRSKIEQAERALARASEPTAQQQAKNELELSRLRMEAARIQLAIIESLQEYEDGVTKLWQLRFDVANPTLAKEKPDLKQIMLRLSESLAVFEKERTAGEGRAMSLRSQITTLETQLANWTPESGDKGFVEQQLAILKDRDVLRTRIQIRAAQVINLGNRVLAEVRMRQLQRDWIEQISDGFRRTYSYISKSFDRELTEIGGESITVRKIFYLLVILIVGLAGGHIAIRFIRMSLQNRWKLESNVVLIFEKLSHYFWFIIVIYFALNYVNIPLTIFTFLGGAIALGIGFGAQNLINNFLCGLILMGEQPIRIGDLVEIDGKTGIITNIGARASHLKLFSGIDMLIPNSKFLENNVINWTLSDKNIRLKITVGVAYGSATRDVARLMMRAITEHGLVLEEPQPVVVFEDFGDNALMFTAYFWVEIGPRVDTRVVMSDIRHRIDKLFREADISIAYPQRDLHLDTIAPIEVRLLKGDKDSKDNRDEEISKPHLP